jgi:hypothetical protein
VTIGRPRAHLQAGELTPLPVSRLALRALPARCRGRKLQLRDAVFERLQLAAIKRRNNPSALADEIVDGNLPKLKITSEE